MKTEKELNIRARMYKIGYNKALEEVEKIIGNKFTKSKIKTYCNFSEWLKDDINDLLKQLTKLKEKK